MAKNTSVVEKIGEKPKPTVTKGRKPKYKNREEFFQKILTTISEHSDIVFFNDIATYVGCSARTIHTYFPAETDEWYRIHEAIEENRVSMKATIRKKLLEMNNPTAMIVLYKLIGDEQEKAALNNQNKPKEKENQDVNIELKFS